jgi:aspartyl/asparaginyl beta-hydroxylase (cupin superfamily)
MWFADDPVPFRGSEPFFYDTAQFAWVREVEAQWTVIRDEVLAVLAAQEAQLTPYMNEKMTSRPNQWKTLGLMFWTQRSVENCALFPKSWEIIRKIPHLTAASFNLLEGDTTIKPHMGNTNAIIRCHMGLVVPAPAPRCAFRVGTETRSWDEGRFLMFCDAHQHTAWNNTDAKRYILVVDVMRPEFAHATVATSSRVLAAIYHETAYQRKPWLKRWFGGARGQAFTLALYRLAYRYALGRDRLFGRA